jgi:hypothetical protein
VQIEFLDHLDHSLLEWPYTFGETLFQLQGEVAIELPEGSGLFGKVMMKVDQDGGGSSPRNYGVNRRSEAQSTSFQSMKLKFLQK